jgi:hypothetical protein
MLKSDVVIALFEKCDSVDFPYAAAFGACWANMNDEQRQLVIDYAMNKLSEEN